MHLRTVIAVAGVCVGIVTGHYSLHATEIALGALVLGGMQSVVYVIGRKRDTVGIALSLFTLLFSFGVVLGIVRMQLVEDRMPFVCASVCTFDASVISSPERKDTYQQVVVRPLNVNDTTYDVQIRIPLYPKMERGETIRLSGKVTEPTTLYPHAGEKSFDYASYLHTHNIGSEMLFPKIEVIDTEAHTVPDMLGRWKEKLIVRLDQSVSSPSSALAGGMLFGNASMSKELTDTFRTAGLSHIIVLSGFNIALVISFVLFVFAFVPLLIRILLASLFVIVFVMMVGGEVSVLRATLMAFVALLATLMGRQYVARQALIISLFLVIMYEPLALVADVSLHLSFLATAGIVYISEPIKKVLKRRITYEPVAEIGATTLSAYIVTLPYIVYTFGTVSVYALVTNMIVLPFVPIAMLLSFSVVLASFISVPIALALGYITTILCDAIIFVAQMVQRFPFAAFKFPLSFSAMCFAYVFIGCLILYTLRKQKDETHATRNDGYLTDVISY
jgi:competence protein ComEC